MDDVTFLDQRDRNFLDRLRQELWGQADLDGALFGLIEKVKQRLTTEAISIFAVDEEDQELSIQYAVGPVGSEVVGLRLSAGQGVVGWVVEYNEPLIVPSTDLDPRFYSGIDERTGFVTRSILCVPIRDGDQVSGALEALNKTRGSFNDDDVLFLQAVAQMVSEAWAESRVAREVEPEAEPPVEDGLEVEDMPPECLAIGQITFSADVGELMEQVVKCLSTEAISIFVLDEARGELLLQHTAGPIGQEIQGMRIPVGEGVVGWVARYADPLIVPKPGLDPRFLDDVDEQTGFVTRSILCVPIVSDDEILGAVEVLNKTSGNFDDDDVVFLQEVANRLVDIIDEL